MEVVCVVAFRRGGSVCRWIFLFTIFILYSILSFFTSSACASLFCHPLIYNYSSGWGSFLRVSFSLFTPIEFSLSLVYNTSRQRRRQFQNTIGRDDPLCSPPWVNPNQSSAQLPEFLLTFPDFWNLIFYLFVLAIGFPSSSKKPEQHHQ